MGAKATLLAIYCTVTMTLVECWIFPDVAVTVTVKFCGGGPLMGVLPPPHAAGRMVASIIKRHSAQIRRFLSKPVARRQPSKPSGIHAP